jgi:hypothetical protein
MRHAKPNRREALEAAGLALLANLARAADGEMPYRTLGNTGQQVSCIGMGGSQTGKPSLTNAEAIRLIREALDRGMNFMDNSWDYNKGDSEVRMGNALKDGYRQKTFLMTKFDGRTKDSAMKQIDESLTRRDHTRLTRSVFRGVAGSRRFGRGAHPQFLVAAHRFVKRKGDRRQLFVCFPLLVFRLLKEPNGLCVSKLFGHRPRRSVSRNFVMFDLLGGGDHREVAKSAFTFIVGDRLGTFRDKTLHGFAGLTFRGSIESRKNFLQPDDVILILFEMLLTAFDNSSESAAFTNLGRAFVNCFSAS